MGQAWSVRAGCPLDRWTGQDSGTSLVSEGGMSNGHPVDIHWTGGLDRTAAHGHPMHIPCTSHAGGLDRTGGWDQ